MMRGSILSLLALFVAAVTLPAHAHPPSGIGPRRGSDDPVRCDLGGEWIGDALDEGGTRWTFPLRVTQRDAVVDATIEWHGSNGTTGRETVRGRVDCATRSLELQTVSVTGANLVPGSYHVMLAHDFSLMTGTWDGPNVLRARFTIRRR
jgi:hypothetical protein